MSSNNNSDNICVICHVKTNNRITACGCKNVYFHQSCFDEYIEKNNGIYKCPHCQTKFKTTKNTKTETKINVSHCWEQTTDCTSSCWEEFTECISECIKLIGKGIFYFLYGILIFLQYLMIVLSIPCLVSWIVLLPWQWKIYNRDRDQFTDHEWQSYWLGFIIAFPPYFGVSLLILNGICISQMHKFSEEIEFEWFGKIVSFYYTYIARIVNYSENGTDIPFEDIFFTNLKHSITHFFTVLMVFLYIGGVTGSAIYTTNAYKTESDFSPKTALLIALYGIAPFAIVFQLIPLIVLLLIGIGRMLYVIGISIAFIAVSIKDCVKSCCCVTTNTTHYNINSFDKTSVDNIQKNTKTTNQDDVYV